MRHKTYKVYKFSELSEESQEKALDNLRDIDVDYDWWEHIFEEAKNIGLKIESFEINNREISGRFIESIDNVVKNIIEYYNKDDDRYKTAQVFLNVFNNDDDFNRNNKFLNDLLCDYSIILQKEFDYLISDEVVRETIITNDYEFLEDGSLD